MIFWIVTTAVCIWNFQTIYAGETKYVAVYQDEIRECEESTKQEIDFSKTIIVQESGKDGYITGDVTIKQDITAGTQIKAEISHEVDGAYEYVCGIVGDVCEELENEDTPWYPIFKGLGITECPIKKDTYKVDKISLNISNFEDYLSSDYCGDYLATISLLGVTDEEDVPLVPAVLSCHEFSASVMEVNEK